MSNKYAILFDGDELLVEDITDEFPSTNIEHEYLEMDGASVEPKGQKARKIRFKAWFIDEDYPWHKYFLNKLKGLKGPYELIHPMYGLMFGFVGNVTVHHDHDDTSCSLDITFTETIDEPEPKLRADIEGSLEDAFVDGFKELEATYAAALEEALGADGADLADTEIPEGAGIMETLSNFTGTVREYASAVSSAVARMDATMNQVSSLANSVVATVEFATNLPGRVAGSIANVCDRVASGLQALNDAPGLFAQNFMDAIDQIDSSLSQMSTSGSTGQAAVDNVRKHLRTQGAMAVALHVGYIFGSDEDDRDSLRKYEQDGGADSPPDVLTVHAIEESLALTRVNMQAAVDEFREIKALKIMADALLEHASHVKLEKDRIKTILVDNPTPLLKLCHDNGLPYKYAARVLALNPQIKNPNFISGQVQIYVRQG
jgi:prophage DNA circulation protein